MLCWRSECVVNALNYGLYELKVRGTVDRLYLKYFPVIGCSAGITPTEADSLAEEPDASSRRRMDSTSDSLSVDSASKQDDVPRQMNQRKLKSGSTTGRNAAQETVSEEAGVPQIGIDNLKGLFLIWVSVTTLLIAWTYTSEHIIKVGKRLLPLFMLKMPRVSPHGKGSDNEEQEDEEHIAHPDNEMAMLRDLTRHIFKIKKDLRGMKDHMGMGHVDDHEEVAKVFVRSMTQIKDLKKAAMAKAVGAMADESTTKSSTLVATPDEMVVTNM